MNQLPDLQERQVKVLRALKLGNMTCGQLADCTGIPARGVQGAVLSLIRVGQVKKVDYNKNYQSVYGLDEPAPPQDMLSLITAAMAKKGSEYVQA